MQVIVDGLATNYERSGAGKTVLIVHGWADQADKWKSVVAQLAADYDVIAVDLPGFGATESPKNAWGLTDYALFLSHFLTKIHAASYAIIAHSNGGAITIRGLSINLLTCKKLVLLASAGIRGEYQGRNKALRMAAKTGKALARPLPGRVQRRLRQKVYKTIGSDMLVAEHLQETFKKIVSDDVRADAGRLQMPTLLIYGEDDDQAPVRYGEVFHQAIEGSTLEILPHAGHFLYRERQADVLRAVREFLA